MDARRSFAVLLLAGCFGLGLVTPADATPFTINRFSDSVALAIGETSTTNNSTTTDLTTVDIFSDFGVNRLSITSRESSGSSSWLDEWTITGGSGSGQIAIAWSLDGSLSVTGATATDSASIAFTSLFGKTPPAPGLDTGLALFGGTTIASASQTGAGTTNINQADTLIVSFTYGVPFTAGFRLGGGIGDDVTGGAVSFYNSGLITSVILPDGASLSTTNTRIGYPLSTSAAVPEPGTLVLISTGLAAFHSMRRRRREK